MCWKQEWAMAIHNLALAEIHIGRAEAKLQKRLGGKCKEASEEEYKRRCRK